MNWNDFSVVLAVARENSFTGAAQVLKVAHTTIGRRISDIEEKLGAKLFIRTRTACIPTDDCREILNSIERMEVEALAIGDHFRNYDQKPRGLVKITTMPWIIKNILVPALPSFPARYSELELQFIGDTRERSIITNETDLSLRFDTKPRERESILDLADFSYSLYAPDVGEPDKMKWVTYWEDYFYYQPEKWIRNKQDDGQRICVRANDASFVLEAIRAGIGKGVIPDFLGSAESKIIRFSDEEPEFIRTLKLLYHPDMRKLARIDAVISWLQEVFKGLDSSLLVTKK